MQSITHSTIQSNTHLIIHSTIYSIIHSIIHSMIHSMGHRRNTERTPTGHQRDTVAGGLGDNYYYFTNLYIVKHDVLIFNHNNAKV